MGHPTRYPNTVAWFLLHAFCHDESFGSGWCAYILCHVLGRGPESLANEIVDRFGQDLMDLAHLVEVTQPVAVSVQSIILEALLRYGKIQHKVYNHSDLYEGEGRTVVSLRAVVRGELRWRGGDQEFYKEDAHSVSVATLTFKEQMIFGSVVNYPLPLATTSRAHCG